MPVCRSCGATYMNFEGKHVCRSAHIQQTHPDVAPEGWHPRTKFGEKWGNAKKIEVFYQHDPVRSGSITDPDGKAYEPGAAITEAHPL